MMNKSESKYFNTAIKMDKAFLEILGEKDFEFITVKEICQKAGVHRSTFYLHYETIEDLLDESLEYMNRQFLGYFPPESGFIKDIENLSSEELYLITPKYLEPYLISVKENKNLFQTAIKQSAVLRLQHRFDEMFALIFNPILERYSIPENEKKYVLTFYTMGIISVITEWLKSDCEDSVTDIIELIVKCVGYSNNIVNRI